MEKPLLLKETLEKESVRKINETGKLLQPSEVNETLCEEYEKYIRKTKFVENPVEMIDLRKDIVKELENINSEAKENNIHLKEMLNMSAGCFITQFLASENSLKKS